MIGPPGPALRIAALAVSTLLAACGGEEMPVVEGVGAADAPAAAGRAQLVTMPRPPILAAEDPGALPLARLNAERTRWGELYARTDARLVSVEEMPFLLRTAAGRAFLAAAGPRAIARGMPEASCPATVTLAPGRGEVRLPDLVGDTLSACMALLRPEHPDCGCRVLAVGDFLTVPREEMSYATGTTARLRAPALGLDGVFVAEEEAAGMLIRDLRGPIARVTRPRDGEVRVTLLRDRGVLQGRSLPVGYRRGRVAERIYASGPGGVRLSLLVGFSPEELAEGAAAWLAWPAEG